MKKPVPRTERILFAGRRDARIGEVLKLIKPRDFNIEYLDLPDPDNIYSVIVMEEPAAIFISMELESINALMKVAASAVYRYIPVIAFASESGDAFERFSDELGLDELIILSDSPRKDAKRIERRLKELLQYSAICEVPELRSHIAGRSNWYDPEFDPGDYWNEIADLFERLGIRRNLAGYGYLVAAVTLQSARDYIDPKRLYETVAETYATTPSAVEKSIRYAIEDAWTSGDIYTQHRLFGLSVDESRGKPTNAEFIARLALEFKYR